MNSTSIEPRFTCSDSGRRFGPRNKCFHSRHRRARIDVIANALDPLESRMLLAAYSVIDLGSLGDESVVANGLTNSGIIAGYAYTPSGPNESAIHAFVRKDGKMTDLDPADADSRAVSVSASGEAVGHFGAWGSSGTPGFFSNGSVTPLNKLLPKNTPWAVSAVSAINDDGTVLAWVVAKASPTSTMRLALLNTKSGVVTDLGKFNSPNHEPATLNNAGDAIATSEDSNHTKHAFVFSAGRGATEIAPLSGGDVIANDINDAGDVVGSRLSQPFLSHGGQITELDTGVFTGGEAVAINNHGDIVGTLQADQYSVYRQPFIYSHGQMQLLNSLIPGKSMTILSVTDINDSGQILVNGVIDESDPMHITSQHAYLLAPNAGTSGPDDVRPQAVLQAPQTITAGGGTTFTFDVHYSDNVTIAPGSIHADGVSVTGPSGFTAKDIAVVSQATDSDGHGVTVTYSVGARGGVWNPADNGTYYVSTGWDGATDTAGNHAGLPSPLGLFQVNIPSSTADFDSATQSDMAVDVQGTLHVAFYDANDKVLKYATRSTGGTWSATSVIDSNAGAGQFISIAIDAAGHPGVAYYAGGTADLKYAHFDGTNWTTTTIDFYHTTGGYPSLVFDANGLPAIAYWRKSSGDLRLARFDGTQWNIQTLDSAGNTGRFPSLKVDPGTHRLALAWEDHDGGAFKYASENVDGTYSSTVIDNTTPDGGGFVSLAFSPTTGNPAFSYYDSGKGDLKLAVYDNAAWQFTHLGANSTIGLYSRLSFNNDGVAVIYAYDRSGNDLFRATSLTWSLKLKAKMLHIGGGRGVNMLLTGGAGDTTLAFLDSDLTHLHVEEYVGL